jgi:hydrogenase-1 operon protein HyaF
MTRLSEIPVRVEPAAGSEAAARGEAAALATQRSGPLPEGAGLFGGVEAILSELVSLLERLADLDSPGSIDLRSLPMSAQDRASLQRVLGDGEVQATVNARGLSKIQETRFSGIWWVEHFDQDGTSIAESIEVSRVPEILSSAPDEIAADALELRARITARSRATPGVHHAPGR